MDNRFIGIGKRIKGSIDRKYHGGDRERVLKSALLHHQRENRRIIRENIMEMQKEDVNLNKHEKSEEKDKADGSDSTAVCSTSSVSTGASCVSHNNGQRKMETISSSDSVDSKEDQLIIVTLHGCPCSKSCLGFQIEGGSDTALKYICIQSLVLNSPSDKCGLFRKGDQLVMIGEECLIGVTLKEALEILRQAPASVEVIAQRKGQGNAVSDPLRGKVGPSDCQLRGTKMAVELHCGPGETFGFSIIGGRNDPFLRHIHVSSIH